MKQRFKGRNIISIKDLSRADIIHVLETAKKLEKKSHPRLMEGKVLATLFYEPSTRTRLSFESSMNRLGGRVISVADKETTSFKKGECVKDTVRTVECYSDIIVIRHSLDGAPRVAAESTRIPVINAGDGANQHPTQTLLDLYSIKKCQGRISNLHVALVGDLKFGRTVHSLAVALAHFNPQLYFVSPESLKMPEYVKEELNQKFVRYSEHEKVEEVLQKVDILYVTRLQRERFPDPAEYEKVKGVYIINKNMIKNVRSNFKIMHPLPRVNEISQDIDDTQYAHYFEQVGSGIPIRQALLGLVTGVLP